MVQQSGSDLHLTVGSPPIIRQHGHLTRIRFRELAVADLRGLLYEIMTPTQRAHFEETNDTDFAYELHENKKSLVNQREIGTHTKSYAAALRAALREDPDVILVGEMRDLETIALGITAAKTGHLVFGTLHTNPAAKTVDRIINAFPADEQEQIRAMLSETLRGVVAQQLLRKAGGSGRGAALEIMVGTPAVGNMIREGKTHEIPSMIQTGKKEGMQMMDQAILDYLMRNVISPEEAYGKAHSKAEFLPYLDGRPGAGH
jgi:twitching motility protein PilT